VAEAPVRSRSDPATVVGVDGCSAGWIGVVLHEGAFTQAVVAAGFCELVGAVPLASIVAIDIPIGISANGWRRGRYRSPPLPWRALLQRLRHAAKGSRGGIDL
jgi:predicted RNase H-like nuclease